MESFNATFIKCNLNLSEQNEAYAPAPLFRRKFNINKKGRAVLRFCGLGYGYCYINGKSVSEDLLCAPVSEYNKLLWYNEYDVTELLNYGENIIAVILGNGFFNENFPSAWNHNEACWRDLPKLALQLYINGETVLKSDESFKCKPESFITYNQLRSGETFDARLYDENWKAYDFCENGFEYAITDNKLDSAERKCCCCEPVREFEQYDFVSAVRIREGYLLDFGVNISGYLRICVDEAAGTVIEMYHAEEANPDGTLKLNGLDIFYPTVDFQTDRYICGGKKYIWSPKFTYHGFRFVLVKGLTKPPEKGEFKAIFVHQAVERNSEFECSNELINKIYNAGIRSVYSNLHYALTDCPTREKLGWTNDAQATLEQLYINFKIEPFMKKWGTDILFSMRENGEIPAVVPSHGWGFGHGPVADGILFQIPYIEYLYKGNTEKLKEYLPYLEKHYRGYVNGCTDSDWWLGDWDGLENRFNDKHFVFLFYRIKYCKIIILAQKASGLTVNSEYLEDLSSAENEIKKKYIDENGRSVTDSQTVISLLLSLSDVDKKPLIEQLKKRIKADDFHITSGMWGIQYIYDALFQNNAAEYAYKLITAKGSPSYSRWFEQDATTLWETWENRKTDSKNHHMFSNVLAVFHKYLLGIAPDIENAGFKRLMLKPHFITDLKFCRGSIGTEYGKISAEWKRLNDTVEYKVSVPHGIVAYYNGQKLCCGENRFIINIK